MANESDDDKNQSQNDNNKKPIRVTVGEPWHFDAEFEELSERKEHSTRLRMIEGAAIWAALALSVAGCFAAATNNQPVLQEVLDVAQKVLLLGIGWAVGRSTTRRT